MKRLDVLRHPLKGSSLIEASAGTGKTFTIALLYVRLVLGHGQDEALAEGVLPPNLLVVTFTEAATKELRERIRQRLAEAADVFADSISENSQNALLFAMRNDYQKIDWPAKRKQLLQAIEWMDEAAVSTIHSWCYRMLSEHAFDSGNLFDIELVADEDPLFQQVVRDYWRSQVYPLHASDARALVALFKTPSDLAKSIRGLLDKIELIDLPFSSLDELFKRAAHAHKAHLDAVAERIDLLKQLDWSTLAQQMKELLERHAKALDLNRKKSTMLKAWAAIADWQSSDLLLPLGLKQKGLENHRPHAFLNHINEKLSGENLAQALTLMESFTPILNAIESIYEVAECAEQWQDPRRGDLLSHAAIWVNNRLQREKGQRVEMGFNDLLARLNNALSGERADALARKLRTQFPVALIDEFQDTDQVQYSIFERIYAVSDNDPSSCFLMIGDPKQAIYGFRGGDIHTYMRARAEVGERNYTLDTNFRSHQNMVAAVNRLFEEGERLSAFGAFSVGSSSEFDSPDISRSESLSRLPFWPVKAQGTERAFVIDGVATTNLNIRTLDTCDKKGDFKAASGLERDRIAASFASEIVALLKLGQGKRAGFQSLKEPSDINFLSPSDLAILVNNFQEAQAIREALAQRGVKSVFLSDRDSVLQSAVAVQMLHWIRAFNEPQQVNYLRAALATPVLGYDWQALDSLVNDELMLEREIERFFNYKQLWERQGILPAIRAFLLQEDLPARLLAKTNGERDLTDILHIAEILQEEAVRLDGEFALIHFYKNILQAQSENMQQRSLRLESDAKLVQVITIHKSKGLEYPLVFIPFGTALPYYWNKSEYLSYRDDKGEACLALNPNEDLRALADRERLSEDVRKLYVALTRARYATWLGSATVKDWHMSALAYLFGGERLAGKPFSEVLTSFSSCLDAIDIEPFRDSESQVYKADEPPSLGSALKASRDLRSNWWIASYSRIAYLDTYSLDSDQSNVSAQIDDARRFNTQEEPDDNELNDASDVALNAGAIGALADSGPEIGRINYHAFPRGAVAGDLLHNLLEWCTEQSFADVLKDPSELEALIEKRTQPRGWSSHNRMLLHWVLDILQTPFELPDDQMIRLADLTQVKAEMEFWFESHHLSVAALDRLVSEQSLAGARRPQAQDVEFNGMLKGFIDLIFEYRGRYYILDYKSTSLGTEDADYTLPNMTQMMLKKRYDMQYLIYLLALHRLLRQRIEDYDYDQHIGGAVYLFIRGVKSPSAGAFFDKPKRELIEAMDLLFKGGDVNTYNPDSVSNNAEGIDE